MCLSTAALALFLNTIGLTNVSTQPGMITVSATDGDVHWLAHGDNWCTMAPQLDRKARFTPGIPA